MSTHVESTARVHFVALSSLVKEVKVADVTGFTAVVVLWSTFAVALLLLPASVHDLWIRVGDLPVAVRVGAWIVFLPWMAATAAWEASWPVAWRALVVVGVAWATIYAFIPRRGQ